jgi:polyisoprenyl-teichoic acid--peptidoglycan teichoic acid transferase
MKSKKLNITKSAAILFVFMASFVVSFLFLKFTETRINTPVQEDGGVGWDEFEEENDSEVNVLLLGYGGEGHDGGYLTDVIMLVNLKPDEKIANFITIPRDTWVKLPVRSDAFVNYKINAAYAIGLDDKTHPLKEPQFKGEMGGFEMARYAVETVTGITVDYFVGVDFNNFEKAIDALGGVDVLVEVSFNDYFYPVKGKENDLCGFSPEKVAELHIELSGFNLEKQFICRYEHLYFEKGINLMDGKTALKFVRSRHSGEHGGDFARSQRQIALLSAVRDKVFSLSNSPSDYIEFFENLSSLVKSNVDLETFKQLLSLYGNPEKYEINIINLTTENVFTESKSGGGAYILQPKSGIDNFAGVQKFIIENLK